MRHLSCRGRSSQLIQVSLQGQCVSSLWGDEATHSGSFSSSCLLLIFLPSFWFLPRFPSVSRRPPRPPVPRPPSVISTCWEKITASLFVPLIRPPSSCRSGTFWNESSFVFFILYQTETDVLILSWTCSPRASGVPLRGSLSRSSIRSPS